MSKLLPVIPMRSAVVFPGATLPVTAGRPATLKAIEAAMRDPEHRVFVVAQKADGDEVHPDRLYTIGVIATIGSVERGLGGVRLALQGHARANAIKYHQNGYITASVVEVPDQPPLDANAPAFLALHRELRDRSAELAKTRGLPDDAVEQMLAQIQEPGQLADLVATYLDVPMADRQALLETTSVEDRMRRTLIHVQRQIEVLSVQKDIQSRVKEELGDRQREVLLREQMKAIQKELGESDDAADESLKELKDKLDKLPLPDEARREVDRE